MYEIIFTFIVSFLGADGEEEDLLVTFINGSTYGKCLDSIACLRVYDRHIFLNILKSGERDPCGRSPLQHEVVHFRYLDHNIHGACSLNAPIVRIRTE